MKIKNITYSCKKTKKSYSAEKESNNVSKGRGPNKHEKSSFACDNSHFHLFYRLRARKMALFAKFVSEKKGDFWFIIF